MSSRPRFSIAALMGIVVVCAVGIAALRYASELWENILFTLTLGLLAFALLGAIYRRGPRRAFWVGFALIGWGYLLLGFGPWCAEQVRPHLITTWLVDRLYPSIAPSEVIGVDFDFKVATSSTPSQKGLSPHVYLLATNSREPFQRIGQCLWALLLAFVGGRIARRLFLQSLDEGLAG